MSQNLKLLFYLKKGRNRDLKSLPIYVRITVNGERLEWTSQRRWDMSRWNKQAGRAMRTKEEAKNINNFLDAIQANMFDIQKEFMLRNEPLSASIVRSRIFFHLS